MEAGSNSFDIPSSESLGSAVIDTTGHYMIENYIIDKYRNDYVVPKKKMLSQEVDAKGLFRVHNINIIKKEHGIGFIDFWVILSEKKRTSNKPVKINTKEIRVHYELDTNNIPWIKKIADIQK